MTDLDTSQPRPVVFDYDSVTKFVGDMLAWRKHSDPDFSIRAALGQVNNCSPTLVSQVTKGTRSLTRDKVQSFSRLLALTTQESKYLDQWVALNRQGASASAPSSEASSNSLTRKKQNAGIKRPARRPQNNLLDHWLNLYVRESSRLKDFTPDPVVIHRLLGGLASIEQIKKSLDFLLREGFLRRTLESHVVQNQLTTISTDEVPDRRIVAFHHKALEVVKRGLDLYPINQRCSEAYVLAVNEKNLPKIKKILTDCMDQIEQFEAEHAEDNERLYQVTLHLSPIGGRSHDAQ